MSPIIQVDNFPHNVPIDLTKFEIDFSSLLKNVLYSKLKAFYFVILMRSNLNTVIF